MKLPTVLGQQLLLDRFRARMDDPADASQAVAAFQRMALVADLETAVNATKPWFANKNRHIAKDSPDMGAMKLVHSTVKQDVLGMAVDAIIGVMQAGMGSTKDKLAAAAIMNELFGDKQIIQDAVLTDKLVMNLVGDNKV